jgi:transposase InsO family protein
MFLIVVDSHSKWLEVLPVGATANSRVTIEKLRQVFATHGLPEKIVTDNGSVFSSEEFRMFTQCNGIQHVFSAPYHPASNGLAERAVQTFKEGIKRMEGPDLPTKLSRFLFRYRITPHTTTGQSPAQMLMGRQPRSHLDILHPDVGRKVATSQARQEYHHNRTARDCTLEVGSPVYVKNFGSGPSWLPGQIESQQGPVSYQAQLDDG